MTFGAPPSAKLTSSWVVEHYWPGLTREIFRSTVEQLRSTAEAMARDGTSIRLRHSTLVPGDGAAYSVIDAVSQAVVEELHRRAGVPFDRILTAAEV
jgi:hypothetical protein